VQARGTEDVGVEAPGGNALDGIDALERRTPVDLEGTLAFVRHSQHQLLSLRIGRKLGDLDRDRADGPGIRRAANGERPVRRLDLARERAGGALGDVGRAAEDDELSAGERDERGLLARSGAVSDRDRVPLARARDAGDARLDPAERPRVFDQATWGSMSP
jgi:hypothetical protein